jgi:hypothetical protein
LIKERRKVGATEKNLEGEAAGRGALGVDTGAVFSFAAGAWI